MPVVSDETFQWARDCFESAVEALLDDPSDLCHQFRQFEKASEEIGNWRALGVDLGMDFDALVEKHGSDYEKQRLRDIEAGVIPAAPRQEAAYMTRLRELNDGYNFAEPVTKAHTEGYAPFLPSRRRVSGDEPFSLARVAEAMPLPSARDDVVRGALQKLKEYSCPVHYSFRLLPSGVRVCQRLACDWTDAPDIGSEATNWMPPQN